MSGWTGGYVADINYTYGYYRELSPVLLQFASLAKGRLAPAADTVFNYCELGCGQGFSANLIAAANPKIAVYATDFNPAQIAGAVALATEAGLDNVHFSDASFAEYLNDERLPQFDFITLHGIYSWVSRENQQLLMEFIRRKLKVGGFVYISFNTLPGWAPAMPLRRLFVEHAGSTGGPRAMRIEKALVFAERMKDAGAGYFKHTAGIAARFDGLRTMNRNYLAHEYFNRDWTPMYFSDVAADLAEAKLDYVGSVHLLDHVDGANLTNEQAALLLEVGDTTLRETIRDYVTLQQFRRDLFTRGAVALQPDQVQERWLDLRLALSVPRHSITLKVVGPLGEVSLQPESYDPVLDMLAGGPKTVRELVADPTILSFGWARLQEVIKVCIGANYVQPCLPVKGEGERTKSTRLLNAAIMRKAVWSNDLAFLASPVTGGGVGVDRLHQMFLLAQHEKRADVPAYVWSQFSSQGQSLLKNGAAIEGDEANLSELRSRYQTFVASHLPLLQHLGLCDTRK